MAVTSVRTIAQRVGVSVATVSRALNNKPNVTPDTRRRVLEEARRAGYVLDRRATRARVIGLAYTGDPGRADYGGFEGALMSGIVEGVNEHRYDINIINIHRDRRDGEDLGEFLHGKGVAGVILRTFEDSRYLCEEIAESGFPSVVVADRFENEAVNFVATESRSESRRAVEHLIGLGHRRIALAVHTVSDTDHRDRCLGYQEALSEAGIELDRSLIVEVVANMEGGANVVDYLLAMREPPTAVFFTDPLATLGALHHCREVGVSVPSDLSVVGFDDSDVRFHTYPAFTAVCQNAQELGTRAALWLTNRLTGVSDRPMREVLPTRFEINRTTAAPRTKPIRLVPVDGV